MITMDRKDRDRDIDVGIFVVYVGEGSLKDIGSVREKFERAWLHPEAVLAERAHDLVERLSRRLVVVEQVAGKQHHVDLQSVSLETDKRAKISRKMTAQHTSCVRARVMISSNVRQLSSLRIASRSSYPT